MSHPTTIPAGQESASVRHFAFRLRPHDDLKQSILNFAQAHQVRAGAVVTCVGSLEQLNLRFANQKEGSRIQDRFEIVSLVGTFSGSSVHLHLCAADKAGAVLGGHLLDENLVYTTAEIVIVDLANLEFAREHDAAYGYYELVVKRAGR